MSERTTGTADRVLAIATTELRRFGRDRTNLFFAFVFPLVLILIIGLQFGTSSEPRLGVAGPRGEVADALLDGLDDVDVVDIEAGDATDRVQSGDLDAALVLPEGLDDDVTAGEEVRLRLAVGSTEEALGLQTQVGQALARAVAVPDAVRTAVDRGADPARAEAAAGETTAALDRLSVRTSTTGDRIFPEGSEGVDVAAPSQLVLFVFVTGLTGSYTLIQARKLGVASRMMSTPTSLGAIVAGIALGRWLIGVLQGVVLVLGTMVMFGVDWGDPVGAAAVVALVSAVSAGAAMCFGTFFSNPEQASGVGTVVGLCLAALGGAMLPIELFSDTLAQVARVTPHYWAIDAFSRLVRHDESVLDILPQLGVLAAGAAVLLTVAAWRTRAVLTRPG